MHIDLNADLGESFGAYTLGDDSALMRAISSANVACGFHAGDATVMRATVVLARDHGVAVGAHPGFADLAGFGRREINLTPLEVQDLVIYQIGALAGVAAAQGVMLQHVKPHGALYNMASRDAALAAAIATAVASVDRSLILLGLPKSQLIEAGKRAGLRTAAEAFADRAYRSNGSLLPRAEPGAVIHDPATVVARAVAMARDHVVTAVDGSQIAVEVDTICVHGDTPDAANLAMQIRRALEAAGVQIQPLRAKVESTRAEP